MNDVNMYDLTPERITKFVLERKAGKSDGEWEPILVAERCILGKFVRLWCEFEDGYIRYTIEHGDGNVAYYDEWDLKDAISWYKETIEEKEMKIEKHLHWDEPIIEIEKDCFTIEINENEIKITCDWDYGYDGRGTERIYVPTKVIKQLIEEIEGAKKNERK